MYTLMYLSAIFVGPSTGCDIAATSLCIDGCTGACCLSWITDQTRRRTRAIAFPIFSWTRIFVALGAYSDMGARLSNNTPRLESRPPLGCFYLTKYFSSTYPLTHLRLLLSSYPMARLRSTAGLVVISSRNLVGYVFACSVSSLKNLALPVL